MPPAPTAVFNLPQAGGAPSKDELAGADWILEQGISGTTNWFGDPQTEQNSRLRGSSAFGVAGSTQWGEWQQLALTDPDVAATLEFIAAPIRDALIDVEATDHPGVPPALAKAQADFVRDQLQNVEPGSAEVLTQMTRGSLSAGFAIHEVVLGLGKHPALPSGEGFILRKLAERLPVSIHPTNGWREKVLSDGSRELDHVQQIGQTSTSAFAADIKLPAEKILLTTWQRSGQNYRGVSAFRAVWYICKIREQLLKLVGIALVREGAGVPVASSGADADILTPAQQRKLARALQNLVAHENASIVMPKGWTVNWVFSPGANKTHIIDVYNALGQLILRQLGAQQMALGTGSTGSRSVGETHNSVAQGYLQSVVATLEGVLNGVGARPYCGLARKLVVPNWGEQAAYPKIKLTLKKASLGPLERVQAMAQAAQAGLITMLADDENQLRDELGMAPAPVEQEADVSSTLLNGAQAAAVQGIVTAVAQGQLPRDAGLAMLDNFFGLSPEQAAAVMGSAGAGFVPTATVTPGPASASELTRLGRSEWEPWRALRPAEGRLELGRIDKFFVEQRDTFARLVRPAVVEMLAKAAPTITEAMRDGDPSEVASMPLDTRRLEKLVGQWLESVREQGQRDVAKELAPTKRAHRLAAGDGEDPTTPEDMILPEPDDSQAQRARFKVMEAQRKSIVKRIEGRTRGWLEKEAIDVVRTGGDADEVISRTVAEQVASNAFRTDAGTALTKIYNVGRDEAAAFMGASQAEYSAILDSNTCSVCLAEDGKVYEVGSDEYEAALPPNRECDGGDNCRCLFAFIPGGAQ